MSEDDTITPESDDEIRARLRALAEEVKGRTDTEAALQRMPRRSRPPTIRFLAIAACLLAVVALAAVAAERQSVDTVPPSESPTTECASTTQPRAITQGAQMRNKFAAPVASAATAILLLGGCSDDGATTVAKGEDVEFVGDEGFAGQTLNVTAEEKDGEVTGEFRVTDNVITIECADTDTDGVVILGGSATAGPDVTVGDLLALIIREGDPDSVALLANVDNAGSCTELLDSIPEDLVIPDTPFDLVEDGYDIETG
jgi:hypothetical protein